MFYDLDFEQSEIEEFKEALGYVFSEIERHLKYYSDDFLHLGVDYEREYW